MFCLNKLSNYQYFISESGTNLCISNINEFFCLFFSYGRKGTNNLTDGISVAHGHTCCKIYFALELIINNSKHVSLQHVIR